jgi:hypothetical protein
MKKEDWTQRLRDRLADHQETAPDDLWADIEKSLDTVEAGRHHARIILLRRIAAAAAVILCLAIGGGYIYFHSDKANSEVGREVATTTTDTENTTSKDKNISISDNDIQASGGQTVFPMSPAAAVIASHSVASVITEQNAKTVPAKNVLADHTLLAAGNQHQHIGEGTSSSSSSTSSSSASGSQSSSSTSKSSSSTSKSSSSNTVGTHRMGSHENEAHENSMLAYGRRHSDVSGDWSVNLYASNVFVEQDNSNGVMMSDDLRHKYDNTMMASAKRSPVFLTDYKEETHHHQPMSFGLTVRYGLSRHFSLSSGVVYTRVNSDFVHIIGTNRTESQQALQYVGVPLNINYQVWGGKRWNAYLSAGGEGDVNVRAKVSTQGTSHKIDKDRMQWSATGAVGLQYNVIPQLGIYIEPGARYYFDNGSDVENIFKEKPLNFSLQFGVRLNVK